jgi:hypothetical protein
MFAVVVAVALGALADAGRVTVAPLLAQDRVSGVLTQVRAALGGEQKLAAVKAIGFEGPFRRVTGARTVDGYLTLLVARPDKLRRSEETRFFGTTTERISTFDGAQAWDETVSGTRVSAGGDGGFGHGGGAGAPGGAGMEHTHDAGEYQNHDHAESREPDGVLTVEQLNASRLRRMKLELQRWTIALLADTNQPFTDGGQAESPDGPADVLETRDEAGRPVRYFIDPANHMPLMLQYQEVRSQTTPPLATVAMHLADYKQIDGVMLPHRISISINGQASEDWTIDKFKINPTVKADVFRKKAK